MGVAFAGLFAFAAAAQPAPPAPQVIARPSAHDLERVYPARAHKLGMGGTARLNCQVGSDGRLEDCRVTAETPRDRGFGEAALQLAPLFRMSPIPGAQTTRVTLPIRFALPLPTYLVEELSRCEQAKANHTAPALKWAHQPASEDVDAAFPLKAAMLNQKGSARIRCDVNANGLMVDCEIAEENPKDLGFGEAALKMAPLLVMTPFTQECESVAGASITIPFTFNLPRLTP